MPTIVFGNNFSTYDNDNKIETIIFVQKPYLRTKFYESNIEEDIDMKKQYKNRKLPHFKDNSVALCKSWEVCGLNDPSITRNISHADFDDKNPDKVRFVMTNSLPAVRYHLTPKLHVDEAISHSVDDSSFSRLDPDEHLNFVEQDSIIPNFTLTSPKTITEIPSKSNVDSLHEMNRKGQF